MRAFASPAALLDAAGADLGAGEWLPVEQDRVDAFAAATDDEQWIHVDPERAAAGPFGAPIAHGYLTLSLLPALTSSLLVVDGVTMAVNYGLDRVRFLQPVRVGSRVRATGTVADARRVDLGVRLTLHVAVEIDGAEVHSMPDAVFRDRGRQNDLMSGGDARLLRFTARDIPTRLAATLSPLLHGSGWSPGRYDDLGEPAVLGTGRQRRPPIPNETAAASL